MKRIIFIMILLFQAAMLAGCATDGVTSQSFQGETDGFRGIPWGTDLAARPDMKFLFVPTWDSAVKLYSRSGDELKFGNVKVNNVLYGAMDGKFYTAQLNTIGVTIYSEFKEAVFRQFGKGHFFVDKEGKLSHQWLGPTTRMFLRYEPLSETAWLTMWSEDIMRVHGK